MKVNYKHSLIPLLLLAFIYSSKAQDLGIYTNYTAINVPAGGTPTNGKLNFINSCEDAFKVNEGKVWVKLDLGENYELGSNSAGELFDITVDLQLALTTSGDEPLVNFSINLNNNKPEALVFVDLKQFIDGTNTTTGLTYMANPVTGVNATINSVSDAQNNIDINSELNISLNYEIDYGISVKTNAVTLQSADLLAGTKVMKFNWEDTCESPNYQFQLLRLFNVDQNKIINEEEITATIDWGKSLSFQTYNSKKEINITIGEGQGYYIWRVRPIGTFNKNGIGDYLNWGNWSTSNYTVNPIEISETIASSTSEIFYFTDVDDNMNYQYSRVFTEGNKISEQLSYATTLNQIRQNQRYFSSKGGYKLITQTVLDKSGRPTLNTLPVPVKEEKINGYKSNFVKTKNGTNGPGVLYKAKHFDDDYLNPAVIDASGAFNYYSSLNADNRIPNAENYPFTRAVFANDGTDRVIDQSGVGKKHMLGDEANGRGKTTKTIYSTPKEEELVALFGDEAPNHQNVAKIITIDPNKTKSVVYITKDGKTIATGLTFSEDIGVLDNVKDANGAIVSGRRDYISNNSKTTEGFMASKRIAILQDNTKINLSYSISKPILEGLCNNIEFNLDYAVKVQVFDALTGKEIEKFEKASIRDLVANPDEVDVFDVDFGAVTLNVGSYYIQKTLVPSDKVELQLVSAEDNIRRLIAPFFNWVVNYLDKVDCEEEMQAFYEDLYFYGKLINAKELAQYADAEPEGSIKFPSNIGVEFKRKDPEDPDAKDEFIDYYTGKEEEYSISINELVGGEIKAISYDSDILGNRVPVSATFKTPCCQFTIPIIFTPPFRVPTPEAIEAYKDGGYDLGLNSGNYTPNTNFLIKEEDNFQYEQDEDNCEVTIQKGNAYPFDFEGYAVSMLHECYKLGNPDSDIAKASKDFYDYMRGWHEPGLFNQMIYHMATDSYEERGCVADAGVRCANKGTFIDKYHTCDIPTASDPVNNAAYTVDQLTECWDPLVLQLVNEICVEKYKLNDQNAEDTVSDNYDEQDPKAPERHDDILSKDNIKNFVIRWIAIAKIRRKIRKQKVSEDGSAKEEAEKQKNNLPYQFLKCTGYTFADILNPDRKPEIKSEFEDLSAEFDGDISNGEYNKQRIEGKEDWSYFGLESGYVDPPTDPDATPVRGVLKDLFGSIKDPVYAFKYYEYKSYSYPQIEGQVCYRDPNLCRVVDAEGNSTYDAEGKEILKACCGNNTNGEPIPCNFCGIGYVKCPYTKEEWDCGQRYTFFEMIKNYREAPAPDGVVVNCENYFEQQEYIINPDFDKFTGDDPAPDFTLHYKNTGGKSYPDDLFSGLPILSKPLIQNYVQNEDVWDSSGKKTLKNIDNVEATSGISIIENDAREMINSCEDGCDGKKGEFRRKLIGKFEERCYVIGECKVDSNDNVVPIEDIEALVNKLVEQCKKQCDIRTYTCVDEPCRLIGDPDQPEGPITDEDIYDNNLTYVDYGVSGPIAASLSQDKKEQKLVKFDPEVGDFVITDEVPNSQNIGQASEFLKYFYTSNPTIWDIRKSLTYAQYSRYIQATEWFMKLDLPSKCDEFGNYNSSLTYNPDGTPSKPVYVYSKEEKKWVEQNFVVCDTPYVTKDNPDGPGDTFVERDKYSIQSNEPLSVDDERLNTPVKSPSAGIKYIKAQQ